MKIKKISYILSALATFVLAISFSSGSRLYFEPDTQTFANNCPIKINIMIDTQGQGVLGSDLIVSLSQGVKLLGIEKLDYNNLGLYAFNFLGGFRDLGKGFYLGASNINNKPFSGKSLVATLILQADPGIYQGELGFVVKGFGKQYSTDTNVVSFDKNIDILAGIGTGKYKFDANTPCQHTSADIQYEDMGLGLDQSGALSFWEDKISQRMMLIDKQNPQSWILAFLNNYYYYLIIALLLLVLLSVLLVKKQKKK